jgi:hypothetical protein
MQPMPPILAAEDPEEVTQHRAVPLRRTPPARSMTEVDLLDLEPAEPSAAATAFEARAYEAPDEDPPPTGFDFGGDAPSRTFTGQLAANAFGGPTAQTGTLAGWPIESATQLNIDPYASDGPSSYMEMAVMTEEPSIMLEPPPEQPMVHIPPADLEMLDLDMPPREEVLDLEAPPREEFLDLEAEMTSAGMEPPTMAPRGHDTVIVPTSPRRKRS